VLLATLAAGILLAIFLPGLRSRIEGDPADATQMER
jgi:hypothetical protein